MYKVLADNKIYINILNPLCARRRDDFYAARFVLFVPPSKV